MESALELVVLEWRPASHHDIDDLPYRVMADYWAVRAGQQAASTPWVWYRTGAIGLTSLSHLFRPGPDGPEPIARCGIEREPEREYRDDDAPPLCQRCEAIAANRPLSVGTIGDLDAEMSRGG